MEEQYEYQHLQKENIKLKQQLLQLTSKYKQLDNNYNQLNHKYQQQLIQLKSLKQMLVKESMIFQQQQMNNNDSQSNYKQSLMINQIQNIKISKQDKVDLTVLNDEVKLIEGSFIIQKTKSNKLNDCIKYCFPKGIINSMKQLLELVMIYTFANQQIAKIVDDGFDSRRNEINFGTLFEDLFYVFENNDQPRENLPTIMKKMYIVPKRYIHAMVKPQIIIIDGQQYQTETIYGFISPLPLRPIFSDLNRLLLHEIKYEQLKNNEQILQDKYNRVGKIMQRVSDFTIKDFPIQGTLKTGIASIEILYPSPKQIRYYDRQALMQLMKGFNFQSISKIIHYCLAQKHVLIVGKNRKTLNEMFEIIRLSIYPFNWLFPIVYCMIPQFYPYLQSPMPIIAGCLEYMYKQLPKNDFITIFLDQSSDDLNEIQQYNPTISQLHNRLTSCDHGKQSTIIKKYIKSLRDFIETGKLTNEMQQFHIDFMETQLVSFYKQPLSIL